MAVACLVCTRGTSHFDRQTGCLIPALLDTFHPSKAVGCMATKLVDTRTEIETPENVTLTFDVAGPGSRLGAYLLDLMIRIGIYFAISIGLSALVPVFGTGLPTGASLIVLFLLEWSYGAICEGFWNGRSPGKRAFGLRVIKDAGYPISFYDALIRNLLRAADILPIGYGIGLITMCVTQRMQRIGDLVAGTMVVHERREALQRHVEKSTKLVAISKAECLGTFHVSERTLDVVERLLGREDKLTEVREDEIAAILAKPLAAKLGIPIMLGRFRHTTFLRRILKTFSGGASE